MQLNVGVPGATGLSLTAISFAQLTEFMQFLAATAGFVLTCIGLWNWYTERRRKLSVRAAILESGSPSGARSEASASASLPALTEPRTVSEKK